MIPIKETTLEAVHDFTKKASEVLMLTEDSRTTAEAVSRKLGLDDVIAEVLPDQKADVVKRLLQEDRFVAMAGDGINMLLLWRKLRWVLPWEQELMLRWKAQELPL
jgi:Cu+-exporting ATPase